MKLVIRVVVLATACLGMLFTVAARPASADAICDALAKAHIVCTPCPTPNRIGPICYG